MSHKRERDIRLIWQRDAGAPILKRDEAPPGLRTPNGYVWGHQLGHLFWMPRIPGEKALTVWSRTMLMAFGENYVNSEWDEPLVEPRIRRPWPVLRLLAGDPKGRKPSTTTLNAADRGCAHEHPWPRPCPPEIARRIMGNACAAFAFGDCALDPKGECESTMRPNVCEEEGMHVMSPRGLFYDYLWCEHFRRLTMSVDHPELILDMAMAKLGKPGLQPDMFGIIFAGEDGCNALEATTEDVPMSDDTTSEEPSPERDLFSVKGLPKLEEFIPLEFFPDALMVHDPDDTTSSGKTAEPILYKRYNFTQGDSSEPGESARPAEKIAHLHLSKKNGLGRGNHSDVFRAPLTLPAPLSARSPTGQVVVAAKLAHGRCSAHTLLHNEARVYHTFPMSAMEEWCGYNVVPQCRFPVPIGPIAPKFYGFYVPVDKNGKPMAPTHPTCDENRPCSVKWPSPILLMEECGDPVEPERFTPDQRTECFSLVLRLHHMDICQGSFYVRNIMSQPGPLTAPPEERSADTPSFRIIDFGRGKSWDWELEAQAARKESAKLSQTDMRNRRQDFAYRVMTEVTQARRELLVDDMGF